MQGVAARELGTLTSSIRVMKTRTDKVPNTSATAASSGADLNGAAVQLACAELRERLRPIAAGLLAHKLSRGVSGDDVVFADGFVSLREAVRLGTDGVGDDVRVPFGHVAERAYFAQVGLSATGYYRTPDIGYDRSIGRGKPFHYFSYGAAVAEVELDGLTGMKRVRRVDILHDVGDSLNPSIDRGQIEGGFIQGMGWLTAEELLWSSSSSKVPGALLTHSASTYQIPTIGDAPEVFVVELLSDAAQSNVVHGSKAVGEPPLVLALSVREALREAVRAFDVDGREVVVPSPLTHEVLFRAVQERRVGGAERARAVNS
jgi:xanthine dehydrogenase molybdopterin-binding subunit B